MCNCSAKIKQINKYIIRSKSISLKPNSIFVSCLHVFVIVVAYTVTVIITEKEISVPSPIYVEFI